jgi:phage terminase Nu1 subunit (DNA packaging protein)
MAKRTATVTRREAAERLGRSLTTVERLVAAGRLTPAGKRGKEHVYDLAQVDALAAELAAPEVSIGLDADVKTERARLLKAQRLRVERENAVRAGELVERAHVIAAGQTFGRALAAKIRALPHRAGQIGLVDRDGVAALADLCRDLLDEISSWKTLDDLEAAE